MGWQNKRGCAGTRFSPALALPFPPTSILAPPSTLPPFPLSLSLSGAVDDVLPDTFLNTGTGAPLPGVR